MLINGICFPPEIIKAINDNNLVVFAGAGVSIDPPTSLPSFSGLAEEIAKRANCQYNENQDTVDEFLGILERKGMRIREWVAEELKSERRKPNRFHRTILELFKNPDSIRIVTTNQDEMFEAAAQELGISWNIFDAPALPYGDSFLGLVHLHGSISAPDNMVITDTGFGNAYMLNGYATRFLVDLFQKYTVLFVGYSYNDRIVRYLTTAITTKRITNAYILTAGEDSQGFERTNIKPIYFEPSNYDQEYEALKVLGQYGKRGLLDWQQRLDSLGMDSPPIDEETKDEILEGIENVSVQRHFCKTFTGEGWPAWLNDKGVLDRLFDERAIWKEEDIVWAEWLANNYISADILRLIEKHDNRVNTRFCDIILEKFRTKDEAHNDELFMIYLAVFRKLELTPYTLYRVTELAEERMLIDVMWDFFWKMSRISIQLKPWILSSIAAGSLELTYKTNSDSFVLRELWKKKLFHHVERPFNVLIDATRILEDLSLYSANSSLGRGIQFRLENLDIENSVDEIYRDDELYVLCEIIEYAASIMIEKNEELSIAWIKEAVTSDCPLVKKVALKLLRTVGVCDEDKARIVLDNCNIHDLAIRPQVFKLIACIYDSVGNDLRSEIIDGIWLVDTSEWLSTEGLDVERQKYYLRYNWLIWLKSECAERSLIEEKLNYITELYPDFMPSDNPELAIGRTIVTMGGKSPISYDDLYKMEIQDAYAYITGYEDEPFFVSGDKQGLMQTVSDVGGEHFEWCIALIEEANRNKPIDQSFASAILRGMEKSTNEVDKLCKAITTIRECFWYGNELSVISYINACLTRQSILDEFNQDLEHKIVDLLNIIWVNRQKTDIIDADWPTATLNTIEGGITRAFIALEGSREGALSEWFKSFVENKIGKSADVEEAICMLCGQASYLYYRDAEWTSNNVLPYLSNDLMSIKQAAWEGLVVWTHGFSVEFSSAILPYFRSSLHIKNHMERRRREKFIYDYTLILVHLIDDPTTEYIGELLQESSSGDKEEYAYAIRSILEKMSPDARKALWERWLKKYWMNRNLNIPISMERNEYREMLNWLFYIYELDDAIEIALKTEIDNVNIDSFIREMRTNEFIKTAPQTCAEVVISLFEKCDKQHLCNLGELIDVLNANDITDDIKVILSEIRERITVY